jgi:hypothetical protein
MRELHKRVFTTSKSVTIGTAPNHYQPTSQKVKRVSKGLFPPKTHSHQLREAAQTLSAPSSKNLWLVVSRELHLFIIQVIPVDYSPHLYFRKSSVHTCAGLFNRYIFKSMVLIHDKIYKFSTFLKNQRSFKKL